MASIDKEMIQKQLNKSIEILEMTFDKFNLQALTPGEKLTEDIAIKANFYDEDSTIIFSNDNTIDADEFSGYDTIHMYLNEDNLAFNMVKCRIFATRG